MGGAQDRPAAAARRVVAVEEAFLLEHLKEKALAALLLAVVPPRALVAVAPRLKLQPLAGKRWKSMGVAEHARLLARSALADESARRVVLAELNERLSAAGEPEVRAAGSGVPEPAERRAALAAGLRDEASRATTIAALEAGTFGHAAEDKEPARPIRNADAPGPDPAVPPGPDAESKAKARELALRERIDALQHEVADLHARLGLKKTEFARLQEYAERLKEDVRVAFERAARFKRQLDAVKEPSARESELRDALERERRRADIEAAKVEILEYELDLHAMEDDPQPAAPALPARDAVNPHALLAERIRRHGASRGTQVRILVVGGAGRQRQHRERDFERLKEELGIAGEWRFADYNSWHRDLIRLRNDIRDRFDLVFVLHWNRTTFVQRMHDEARAARRPVRTVVYRGFLSLQLAIIDELERLLTEKHG